MTCSSSKAHFLVLILAYPLTISSLLAHRAVTDDAMTCRIAVPDDRCHKCRPGEAWSGTTPMLDNFTFALLVVTFVDSVTLCMFFVF